ncbi:DUF1570 domain-containing protein [Singulisphaera rosea]
MNVPPNDLKSTKPLWSRREWILASGVYGFSLRTGRARGEDGKATAPTPSKTLDAILERAKASKLTGFRSRETETYLAVGDAKETFLDGALEIGKALTTEFLSHFQAKGFDVKTPVEKLVMVVLKDKASYEAYLGEAPGADVGGHYDVETNELVIFDFRGGEFSNVAASPERLNSFTLVHESIHQLSYNTGLLDRKSDVPVALSEGLAMYGELWPPPNTGKRRGAPRRPAKLGGINTNWRKVLRDDRAQGVEWIPIDRLLTDDKLFWQDETKQTAYAEAWLLVHFLLSIPKLAKCRAYFEALAGRNDPKERLAIAKSHLGDLARFDRDVRHHETTLR